MTKIINAMGTSFRRWGAVTSMSSPIGSDLGKKAIIVGKAHHAFAYTFILSCQRSLVVKYYGICIYVMATINYGPIHI
jgi:hypothetical protein